MKKLMKPKLNTISDAAAGNIRAALAAISDAEKKEANAVDLYRQKTDAFWAEDADIERLKASACIDRASDIEQLAALQRKVPFWKPELRQLEAAVGSARQEIEEAKAACRAALGAAALEIGELREKVLAKALGDLTDSDFGVWCAYRAPAVTNCRLFASDPTVAMQWHNLDLPGLAEVLLRGEVPDVTPKPPPPAPKDDTLVSTPPPGFFGGPRQWAVGGWAASGGG